MATRSKVAAIVNKFSTPAGGGDGGASDGSGDERAAPPTGAAAKRRASAALSSSPAVALLSAPQAPKTLTATGAPADFKAAALAWALDTKTKLQQWGAITAPHPRSFVDPTARVYLKLKSVLPDDALSTAAWLDSLIGDCTEGIAAPFDMAKFYTAHPPVLAAQCGSGRSGVTSAFIDSIATLDARAMSHADNDTFEYCGAFIGAVTPCDKSMTNVLSTFLSSAAGSSAAGRDGLLEWAANVTSALDGKPMAGARADVVDAIIVACTATAPPKKPKADGGGGSGSGSGSKTPDAGKQSDTTRCTYCSATDGHSISACPVLGLDRNNGTVRAIRHGAHAGTMPNARGAPATTPAPAPAPVAGAGGAAGSSPGLKCYTCGTPGHKSSSCPARGAPGTGATLRLMRAMPAAPPPPTSRTALFDGMSDGTYGPSYIEYFPCTVCNGEHDTGSHEFDDDDQWLTSTARRTGGR